METPDGAGVGTSMRRVMKETADSISKLDSRLFDRSHGDAHTTSAPIVPEASENAPVIVRAKTEVGGVRVPSKSPKTPRQRTPASRRDPSAPRPAASPLQMIALGSSSPAQLSAHAASAAANAARASAAAARDAVEAQRFDLQRLLREALVTTANAKPEDVISFYAKAVAWQAGVRAPSVPWAGYTAASVQCSALAVELEAQLSSESDGDSRVILARSEPPRSDHLSWEWSPAVAPSEYEWHRAIDGHGEW